MIILKDGVRYELWTPKDEVKDFEPMIVHHIKDIFGPGSEYFPKQKLKTLANIRSIPDGFVVDFQDKKWYIVELKLLCHDAIKRISGQIVDYKNAIKNHKALRSIYKSIRTIRDTNFLNDLIMDENPKIIIIINSLEGELGKQFKEKVEGTESGIQIIEFKTFAREGVDPKKVHIHFFKPLFYSSTQTTKVTYDIIPSEVNGIVPRKDTMESLSDNYSLQNHLNKLDIETKELYYDFKRKIEDMGRDVLENVKKNFVSYNTKKRFVMIKFRKTFLMIYIRADNTLKDPKRYTEYTPKGMNYVFEKRFKLEEKQDIPYAISLIKQSYELVDKNY